MQVIIKHAILALAEPGNYHVNIHGACCTRNVKAAASVWISSARESGTNGCEYMR